MKFLKKIKAIFNFNGKKEELEVVSAEVNQKGVFLHPTEDSDHTFWIKSKSVDIIINPDNEITEADIEIIDNERVINIKENDSDDKAKVPGEEPVIRPLALTKFLPSKRRFTVMLYQDEYDTLMNSITANGYKKTEYFLACMTSAKKKSMESLYTHYTAEHKKRRSSDIRYAKQMQAEDFNSRKNNHLGN